MPGGKEDMGERDGNEEVQVIMDGNRKGEDEREGKGNDWTGLDWTGGDE